MQGEEPSVYAGMLTVLERNPGIIVFMEVNTERMERNKPGSARTFYRKLGLRFRTLKVTGDW